MREEAGHEGGIMSLLSWHRGLDGEGRAAFRSSYTGFVIDAMNVQLYAFVLPTLLALWHLTPSSAGLLASAVLLAGSAGAGWPGRCPTGSGASASCASRSCGWRSPRCCAVWRKTMTSCCGQGWCRASASGRNGPWASSS
jgi:hypothetical protein